ncbi:MAG TPA: hypothetical protein VIJ18_11570 [Microbacteriaceae bacterium]
MQNARRLVDVVGADYRRERARSCLTEFLHGPATYLFDAAGTPNAASTILAIGHPEPSGDDREAAYQHSYPLPAGLEGRAVDCGHFIPYAAGRLYGPNLFVQDRALIRGWSREGRAYRALERASIVQGSRGLLFGQPHYIDNSDIPGFLTLGLITGARLELHRFRNPYDRARMEWIFLIRSPSSWQAQRMGSDDRQARACLSWWGAASDRRSWGEFGPNAWSVAFLTAAPGRSTP